MAPNLYQNKNGSKFRSEKIYMMATFAMAMTMSSQTASSHVLSITTFHWCFRNSSPLTSLKASKLSPQFKTQNATSLGGTNHCLVKFPRETTRTRATLDDTEREQLSSTPLLVEDDKSKKVCSSSFAFIWVPVNFSKLCLVSWKIKERLRC